MQIKYKRMIKLGGAMIGSGLLLLYALLHKSDKSNSAKSIDKIVKGERGVIGDMPLVPMPEDYDLKRA